MPNKTIYVSDGDLPIYERAQELAGNNLSAAIAAALRRYVDVEEGKREGFDEIIVRVGLGKGRKVRFTGVLLGEWLNTSPSRVENFRVYRGRKGKFVLHVERSADYTVVDAEGKPAGWRGYLGIGNISYGARQASRPSRSSGRSRSFGTRSRLSSTTWSPVTPSGPRWKTSTSDPRTPDRRLLGRCGMTAIGSRPAIRATGLRKSYGDHVVLDGIDLEVAEGTVFALLGPNGAGKTTAVRILSTLIAADGGDIQVAGHDIAREPNAVRAVIGVTGQFSAVDKLFTGEENLQLMADLRHLGAAEGRRRVEELIERFDLVEASKKPVATYSGGMKRRLDLAMTLIGDPRIIFLDEPTAGLDPRSRRVMWQTVRDLVAGGVTIFLTTQDLDEADQLAHRIAVLDHGVLVAEGTPDELKRLVSGGHIRLSFSDPAELERAARTFEGASRDSEALTLQIPSDGGVGSLRTLLDRLDADSIDVAGLTVETPDLDDVFLSLTGDPTHEKATVR